MRAVVPQKRLRLEQNQQIEQIAQFEVGLVVEIPSRVSRPRVFVRDYLDLAVGVVQ